MARRKRHHKMPFYRKGIKAALGIVRGLVIGTAAGHGAIRAGAETVQDGNWAEFPARATFYYTGVDNRAGQSGFNTQQLISSLLTIGGGILAATLISAAGKRA